MYIDRLRSTVLRNTLSIPGLADWYRSKTKRLALLFGASLTFSALLALLSPEFLFYYGPLILGIPHVLASIRFTARSVDAGQVNRISRAFSAVWMVYFPLKYLGNFANGSLELAGIAMTLFALTVKKNKSLLPSAACLAFFSVGYFLQPVYFALFLMIAHNFVAFIFWSRAGRTPGEKRLPAYAAAFTVATVFFVQTLSPGDLDLAWQTFGIVTQNGFWLHLFLISQAAHYFIWLKAIPETQSTARTPAPFSTTLKNVRREMGSLVIFLSIACFGILAALAVHSGFEAARNFYLYVAAFHGLHEITALFVPRTQTPQATNPSP